ncbi:MAG: hypothetical protein Q3M30_13540 [Candidatus Electrothrix sp. Rat3]|nr:hypothetical protein [Candidatus Electrothrix rattekaaiensis]
MTRDFFRQFSSRKTMYKNFKKRLFLVPALLLFLLSSCATPPPLQPPDEKILLYTIEDNEMLLSRFAPVFAIEDAQERYNKIGTPSAQLGPDNQEIISVDPEKTTIYARQDQFTTEKGSYTNLIYRIHFEEVPGGFFPYHLTEGKNVGLLFIITLNSRNEPILYTSVHTCGCYLAFVPTSYTPPDMLPKGWHKERQTVYSESLPGLLAHRSDSPEQDKVVFVIRGGTHRVKDIWLADGGFLPDYKKITADLQPFGALEMLPLGEQRATSFYETTGPRKGYVKGSYKSRERLYMSWWAFDWRIGEDKKLGKDKEDGVTFYTSLKPWAREASDLRDFVTFARYWEWDF